MEQDWMLNLQEFAKANREERSKHLRSLTLESAARELEEILEMGPEFWRASEASGAPLPENPLPGPSLAIILGSDPPRD